MRELQPSVLVARLLAEMKTMSRRALPGFYEQQVKAHLKKRPERIAHLLARKDEPRTIDDEAVFLKLQAGGNPPLRYDYDSFSTWNRGVDRAAKVISACDLQTPGMRTLEVCCGDGMVSAALASYGHQPTLLDMDDWRDQRARHYQFFNHDVGNPFPLDDGQFDAVFSYNAFEHIPNPEFALREIVRLARPGGRVHLDFDPIYSSAWGLHAWRTFNMPYPQFLFSEDFILNKIAALGLTDLGKLSTALQPLNKWRLLAFRRLWQECGCQIVSISENIDDRHLRIVDEYPEAFQGRDLTIEDLVTTGIRITLHKVETPSAHRGYFR